MDNTDEITRELLRAIESELIQIEIGVRSHLPTAADHCAALMHELRRIERVVMRRSEG